MQALRFKKRESNLGYDGFYYSDERSVSLLTVFIIANGEMRDYNFSKTALADCDYILACDGGLRHCHAMNVLPSYIIGDMDSADQELLSYYKDVPLMRFVPEKDQTDLELAIEKACDLKADSIVILGGLGKRLDHQLANIHTLAQALEGGAAAEMWDENTKIRLINDYCKINKNDGALVTLLPLTTTVESIVTKGLKYPLENEDLSVGYARGVSNEFTDTWAEITIKSGLLLVVQTVCDSGRL